MVLYLFFHGFVELFYLYILRQGLIYLSVFHFNLRVHQVNHVDEFVHFSLMLCFLLALRFYDYLGRRQLEDLLFRLDFFSVLIFTENSLLRG